ncbi:multiple stress resistance protein BhsA [Buttiauxella noackiae]|uniref:multiple stress resistance protein BhsA n=1 Tax=Buttiauxella noackiae TaxID=82992 RepID=UPI003B5A5D77
MMKNVTMTLAARTLATLSFSSIAANLVDSAPVTQEKVGVITACTSSNSISSLQHEMNVKATRVGASSYRIVGAYGNNRLCGSAEIYK